MTELWMWGIIASLILLAIGTTLKSAHDAFLLKQSDKEVARLRSEIEALNKAHNETISGIQQSNSAESEKLTTHISELEKQIEFHRQKPLKYPGDGGSNSWMGLTPNQALNLAPFGRWTALKRRRLALRWASWGAQADNLGKQWT